MGIQSTLGKRKSLIATPGKPSAGEKTPKKGKQTPNGVEKPTIATPMKTPKSTIKVKTENVVVVSTPSAVSSPVVGTPGTGKRKRNKRKSQENATPNGSAVVGTPQQQPQTPKSGKKAKQTTNGTDIKTEPIVPNLKQEAKTPKSAKKAKQANAVAVESNSVASGVKQEPKTPKSAKKGKRPNAVAVESDTVASSPKQEPKSPKSAAKAKPNKGNATATPKAATPNEGNDAPKSGKKRKGANLDESAESPSAKNKKVQQFPGTKQLTPTAPKTNGQQQKGQLSARQLKRMRTKIRKLEAILKTNEDPAKRSELERIKIVVDKKQRMKLSEEKKGEAVAGAAKKPGKKAKAKAAGVVKKEEEDSDEEESAVAVKKPKAKRAAAAAAAVGVKVEEPMDSSDEEDDSDEDEDDSDYDVENNVQPMKVTKTMNEYEADSDDDDKTTKGKKQKKQQSQVKPAVAPKAANSSGKKNSRYILFVGNIPFDTQRAELVEHFKKAGEVKDVRLPITKDTKKPRGIAFVEFPDAQTYEKALSLHKTTLRDRTINVLYTSANKESESPEDRMKSIKKKNMKLTAMKKSGMLAGSTKDSNKRSTRRAKVAKTDGD